MFTMKAVPSASIVLDNKLVINSWQAIGLAEHLHTDNDIAMYLTGLYASVKARTTKDTAARCADCDRLLTLLCVSCQGPAQSPHPQSDAVTKPPQSSAQGLSQTSECLTQTAPWCTSKQPSQQVSTVSLPDQVSDRIKNENIDSEEDSYEPLFCSERNDDSAGEEADSATTVKSKESQAKPSQTATAKKRKRNSASARGVKRQSIGRTNTSLQERSHNARLARAQGEVSDSVIEVGTTQTQENLGLTSLSTLRKKDVYMLHGVTISEKQTVSAEDRSFCSSKIPNVADKQPVVKLIRLSEGKHHMQNSHSKPNPVKFSCDFRHATFKTEGGFLCHKQGHEKKNFPCQRCEFIAVSEKALASHRLEHRKRPCEICGETRSLKHMQRHLLVHRGEKPHKCLQCDCAFRTSYELNGHLKRVHSEVKPYGCHKQGHEEKKDFPCQSCEFIAVSEEALESHRLEHRKRICEYCGETRSLKSFQRHLLVHRGEKPHKCLKCDCAFRLRYELKCHLQRVHSEVKPYGCEICGQRFTRPENMRHHLRVHNGEKPYKCSMCPSSFSRLDYLQKHTRTHTGETPYKCSDCGQTFAYPNTLKIHKKNCQGAWVQMVLQTQLHDSRSEEN